LPVNKIRCLPIPVFLPTIRGATYRRHAGSVVPYLREKKNSSNRTYGTPAVFALSVRFLLDAVIAALSALGSDFGFHEQVKN